MNKSSREKIALVVFVLLALGSLVGLGWYIVAGHSWNVAASTIDDTVGEMEGYTAIIYPGTTEPVAADLGDMETEMRDSAASKPLLPSLGKDEPEPVDLDALIVDYREKGAETVFLDAEDLARYEEGTIVKRGGKRIGVVSAAEPATQLDVSRCLQAFERAEVDFTVVITPDKWKVSRLVGIDIVICTDDEGLVAMGKTEDGTFYVDAPTVGDAGVVLVSPSNVVSAKEVSAS